MQMQCCGEKKEMLGRRVEGDGEVEEGRKNRSTTSIILNYDWNRRQ
jgi:hypothetical protein